MFRVLVVDDEPVVTESLAYIIKNEIDSSIVVEQARNGREAIEKAWNLVPDIIITDIKMPGINGLGVIREMKQHFRDTRFIILTAYEQFTFAKEAVTLGVDEYLLKPVNRMRMAETIKRCFAKIEEDRGKRARELDMKEKMEKMMPTVESGFLLSLLFFDDFDAKDCRELLELEGESGCMIIIEQRLREGMAAETTNKIFADTCSDVLKQTNGCLACQMSAGKIAAFIPAAIDTGHENAAAIAGKLIELTKSKDTFIAIGIGSVRGNYDELRESYGEAVVALNAITTDILPGRHLHIDHVESDAQEYEDYPPEMKKNLMTRLSMGDTTGAQREFEAVFSWLKKKCGEDFNLLKGRTVELMAYLAAKAFSMEISGKQEIIAAILRTEGPRELRELCKAKITGLSVAIAASQKSRLSEIVVRANEIITRNFTSDISLEGVARELGISPSYFSRLYKEQTGFNFIDYLIKVRIENAKKLFMNSDLSVKEISYMTGYGDPNYFSRLFKKITGMTPTEYKVQTDNAMLN
jgi:two-component system, response regulator YesN